MDSIKSTRFVLGKPILLTSSEGDDYLKSLMKVPGLPERNIVNLILASCGPDTAMLDVGANIGYISLAMSLVAPKGKIHAFEPAPRIFSYLKTNVKANGLKNVTIHELGLSDKKQTTTISYPASFSAGAFVSDSLDMEKVRNDSSQHAWGNVVKEKIKLETLDGCYKKLGITGCGLLKVDIEGHEASFLAGAKGFIAKFKPVTIMEVNHWCLNVFSRTSLPDFVDTVHEHFPHVFAFDDGKYLDLSDPESCYSFFYENTVNNKFQNIVCGFDKKRLLAMLVSVFDQPYAAHLNELQDINARLNASNAELAERCRRIENSKSHKATVKVNRILRR